MMKILTFAFGFLFLACDANPETEPSVDITTKITYEAIDWLYSNNERTPTENVARRIHINYL